MNFVFVSPNYPQFFYKFCYALKERGVCVLGIGDSLDLLPALKAALTEYFFVPDMNDFDAMRKAITHITQKYGQIDGIDSNNEYWLETEGRLREEFHIGGLQGTDLLRCKYKSRMKSCFALGNIPAAPYIKSCNKNEIFTFAAKQGYPLFCKPDNGVGAVGTHKLANESMLNDYLNGNHFADTLFEPYVQGELYSFDGLCDKDGDFVFTAAHRFYTPIDKLKETGCECVYRTLTKVPEPLYKAGCAAVKAFSLKSRFFHLEFFKLTEPLPFTAKKGEFVALEANMRIAGGYTAEMLYHALGLNIYALWAAVVSGEKPDVKQYATAHCSREVINVSRKTLRNYHFTLQELQAFFPKEFLLAEETEKADNPFGNLEIVATFTNEQRLNAFLEMAVKKAPC